MEWVNQTFLWINFKSGFTKITSTDMSSMASTCKSSTPPLNINPNGVEKLVASTNVKKSTGPQHSKYYTEGMC